MVGVTTRVTITVKVDVRVTVTIDKIVSNTSSHYSNFCSYPNSPPSPLARVSSVSILAVALPQNPSSNQYIMVIYSISYWLEPNEPKC